jgi:hypothetical protein
VGHIAHFVEKKNAYRVLVRKFEGKNFGGKMGLWIGFS